MEQKNSIVEEFKRHYTPRLSVFTLKSVPGFSAEKHFYVSHKLASLFFVIALLLMGGAMQYGYQLAKSDPISVPIAMQITEPSVLLDPIVAKQMGRIEANLIRLNALGERLVTIEKLDSKEFNFDKEPGVGDGLLNLTEFEVLLDKRVSQLTTIHHLLLQKRGQRDRSFSRNTSGAGKAVANGWISSFFGMRYDPFTGQKAWHSGVDIAGKAGTPIKALASGIVSYSGKKGRYGRLIEINHGQGLITRYGHGQALLVKKGELVRKGQAIALLGSSGRSTGPHLHLEVHKNGKVVDPGLYFPDLRRHHG